MRIVRLRHPGGLSSFEIGRAVSDPVEKGEVRVRLHGSSLNFHDYLVANGSIQVVDGRIPMSDGAGEVAEIGEGVTDFAVGDQVVSTFFPHWTAGRLTAEAMVAVPGDRIDGYARDEVVAPATHFTLAPAGYSAVQAATLTCAGLTAWRALFVEGRLMPGHTVLVQGTGGVSIFALQFAKAAGAAVIATSSSDEKLERLKALGADHVINYQSDPEWGSTTRKLTDGLGVDHVVEVGGAATLAQSIAASRINANIALIGVLTGTSGEVPTAALMRGNIRLHGITVGSREQQIDMVSAIDQNGIRPVIDKVFPLEAIADAYRYQELGQHFGKICLEW